MHDIRCETAPNGPGHLLARVNGDRLEIYCVKCKAWHAVPIVSLVGDMVVELRNGHEPQPDKRLLW